jgi:ComEC/Rec2-related protein
VGIAFGLGVIFAVRAAGDTQTGVLPVVVLLLASAIVTGRNLRFLCLVAALGCVFGTVATLRNSADDLPGLLASRPTGLIVGEIRSDVDVAPSGGFATFSWRDDAGTTRQSLLFVPPAPALERGDRIEVHGRVDGAFGERIFAERVRVIKRAGWVERQRRAVRRYLSETIQHHVPGTPGALTLGLLIGDDTALTASERDDLRHAGLSHLTAVSGWNVTLVISAVGLLFLRLGLRGWGWTAAQLVALCGFVWIVGLEPPVTRAAIMAVAGLVAIRLGRPAHSVTVLVLSAAVMVAVSPPALSSLSFQLSVLATLGLILAARMTAMLDGWRAVFLTPIIATATIGLITAPLLAAEFGTLSLLTVPANILAGPLVPAATIAGVIVVATSPVEPLAAIAGWLAWLLSGLLLWLTRVLSNVPYGFHEIAPLSDASQAAIYALLLAAVVMILPEGRLVVRRLSDWGRREPVSAILTTGTACVALVTATLAV